MDITTATPAEIDTILAELRASYNLAMTRCLQNRKAAQQARQSRWAYEVQAARLDAVADERQAEATAIGEDMAPLNAEFNDRGGWTRAFVVADGHVHSTMYCSTCNNGEYPTEFGWVTEFSGKTEADVIEAAGSRACTVCYPEAPVDAPAGRIFHETEVAAKKAAAEVAAKKAAADAKKAANAFGPYRTVAHRGDRIDTVYKAKGFLTGGAEWGWSHPSYLTEDRDAVAALLAEKFGTTAQEQIDAAAKRAANRS